MNNERAQLTEQRYRTLKANFFRRGIIAGFMSGLIYGIYSAFLTLGMSRGVWADWYGPNTAGLSQFVIVYMLCALGSAVNDTVGGLSSLGNVIVKGKVRDLRKSLFSKPGALIVFAALFGGLLANTAYVIGLQMAGPMAAPVSALCVAVGAILGRVLYKQALTLRMTAGIALCFAATVMIGGDALGAMDSRVLLGCAISFLAAVGWGVEGCVAGYSSAMVDYEIAITIRHSTSGIVNTLVLVPLFAILAGDIGLAPSLLFQAWTSGSAMICFLISGFCTMMTFAMWYKATAMGGAALGMALNGTYAFFTPLCCWILMGLLLGQPGWAVTPIGWVAAVIMVVGILMIAMNPLDLLRKKDKVDALECAGAED